MRHILPITFHNNSLSYRFDFLDPQNNDLINKSIKDKIHNKTISSFIEIADSHKRLSQLHLADLIRYSIHRFLQVNLNEPIKFRDEWRTHATLINFVRDVLELIADDVAALDDLVVGGFEGVSDQHSVFDLDGGEDQYCLVDCVTGGALGDGQGMERVGGFFAGEWDDEG